MSKSTVDCALPTLSASGVHHVRVSGRRARVSPSYIACVRRPEVRGPPSPRAPLARARSRAPLDSSSLGPPAERAADLRSFESLSRKEKKRSTCTRGTTVPILLLSIRQDARYPGTLSRRVPLTRGRDLIKHEFLRLIKS